MGSVSNQGRKIRIGRLQAKGNAGGGGTRRRRAPAAAHDRRKRSGGCRAPLGLGFGHGGCSWHV